MIIITKYSLMIIHIRRAIVGYGIEIVKMQGIEELVKNLFQRSKNNVLSELTKE